MNDSVNSLASSGRAGGELVVVPVRDKKTERDFYALRRRLYKHNRAVVFPLRSMEKKALDPEQHPFYHHASRELFVAYRAGECVGRIVAIKDEMHLEHHADGVGFFGFYEADEDQAVTNALLATAESWLRDCGCSVMRGPVNPSMKSDFGVLVDGHEFSPAIMMAYTHKRYEQQLLDAGFAVANTFFAFRYQSQDAGASESKWKEITDAKEKILKRYPQLQFRPVDAANYDNALREINILGNEVRSEGWGFVPLTDAELQFMIDNLRRVIRFDLIHMAYWEDQLVGYIVSIPDVNWALSKTWGRWDWLRMLQMPFLLKRAPRARVIALGVDKAYRNKGAAMLLINEIVQVRERFEEWEFSWVLESNQRSIRAIGRTIPLVRTKTYRLYDRPIS